MALRPFLIPDREIPGWADQYVGPGTGGCAVLQNVPEADYHGTYSMLSKSQLDWFADCPARYRYNLDHPSDERSEALDVGSAFHCLVLEPDYFHSRFVEVPNFGRLTSSRTRELRAAWIRDEAAGRTPLTGTQVRTLTGMRDALYLHPKAKKLLPGMQTEVTALWTDPHTGLICKSRADGLSVRDGVFLDLKSALSANPRLWKRAALEHRYHVQDAFYSRAFEENGIGIQHFIFLVVEKHPPYLPTFMTVGDASRLAGEMLYMRELAGIRKCWEIDAFPGYDGGDILEIDLPEHGIKPVLDSAESA